MMQATTRGTTATPAAHRPRCPICVRAARGQLDRNALDRALADLDAGPLLRLVEQHKLTFSDLCTHQQHGADDAPPQFTASQLRTLPVDPEYEQSQRDGYGHGYGAGVADALRLLALGATPEQVHGITTHHVFTRLWPWADAALRRPRREKAPALVLPAALRRREQAQQQGEARNG